jgi:AcrR family transcriptional regulator
MRTRLSTEQRRDQLLAIGSELFAQRPYDQVSIEEVAEIARISTGLLYRYFPSKRAFFVAIVELESAKLLQASVPDPELSPLEQLNAGLDVYIGYAERHPDSFRMAQHSHASDHDLHALHQARVAAQRDRILAGLSALIAIDDETSLAVTGWLAFVQTAIIEWLDKPTVTREQLRNLCARTLWAALGVATD